METVFVVFDGETAISAHRTRSEALSALLAMREEHSVSDIGNKPRCLDAGRNWGGQIKSMTLPEYGDAIGR